jgi:penicillin-insensitive murein endopeptidase
MRAAAHLLAVLLLAAAGSAVAREKHLIDPTPPGSLNPEPLPPLQNPDAPSTLAKELFARKSTPFPGPPRSIGGYFDGCLAGGVPLPITGPTWQVMRPSRNRNWGNPQLVRFIERFAENAKKIGWNGLPVGDMSQPRGGPMLSNHKSHQVGLDVDIWFAPMPDHVQSRAEREFGSATDVVAPDMLDVDLEVWTHKHTELIRTAAQDPAVTRILVNAAIKKALCREAGADRTWPFQGASLVWSRRALSHPNRLSGGQRGMQATAPVAPKRRLRSRTRFLVQGFDVASSDAAQTETGADAGRFAPRM